MIVDFEGNAKATSIAEAKNRHFRQIFHLRKHFQTETRKIDHVITKLPIFIGSSRYHSVDLSHRSNCLMLYQFGGNLELMSDD